MNNLTLRDIHEGDISRLAFLRVSAFEDAPAAQAMRPGPITPELLSWMGTDIKKDFAKPKYMFMGVIDNTNEELISFAQWMMVDAETRAVHEPRPEWPDFVNGNVKNEFFNRYEELQKNVMGDKDYLLLHVLATDKESRRRGAASMLLQWGIDYAAQKGTDIFLAATEAGKPLYEKFGFKIMELSEVDLRRHGVDHMSRNYGMVLASRQR